MAHEIPEHIEALIAKQLSDKLSPEERETLDRWREDSVWNDYHATEIEDVWKSAEYNNSEYTVSWEKNFREIEKRAEAERRNRKKPWRWIKVAASVAMLMSVVTITYRYTVKKPEETDGFLANSIEEVSVSYSNGKTFTVNQKDNLVSGGDTLYRQNENLLSAHADRLSMKAEKVTVNVPKGKRIKLKLPDGTKVWLNAATTFSYYTRPRNGVREVAVNGEACFDVVHNKTPFIVRMGHRNVRVLGTVFNVNNYNGAVGSHVTLVEGSVSLYGKDERRSVKLAPGQQALFKDKKRVEISDVNTRKYISWRDDILVFEGQKFRDLIPVLERWYNVSIINNDPECEGTEFSGTFYGDETVADIMRAFAKQNGTSYIHRNDTVYINKQYEEKVTKKVNPI
ncbi:hypothetical protein FUAX_42960 (plasmid) [Fulvitalea axinellae]|uniref:FecR family protein n=1 Tax=Fulvitalea axinellae TaxID=1182444 RepID=A0AAU9CI99_9BACT|nr:hypothetical protein FUAX_42960 [Fulvitalea axinellae]